MFPGDPIYNRLSQDQIDEIYMQKFKIAEKCDPGIIIEIGVRTGYSAYAFLQAVPKALYFGFDCCDSRQAGGEEYLVHAGEILKPYNVALFRKDTSKLESLGIKRADFVSVDGNHTYSYAYHDLELAFDSLKSGGFILVDDTSYIKTVRKAVDDFWSNYNRFKTQIIIKETVKGIRGYMLLQVQKS